MADDKNRAVSAKVHTGDGKSIVIQALAKMHIENGDRVVICVLFEWLLQEMVDYTATFCGNSKKVEVILIENLDYYKSQGRVVIIDESDYVIDHRFAEFKKKGNINLRSLITTQHATKIYFFSATMDEFHKQVFEQVFAIDEESLHQFPKMQSLEEEGPSVLESMKRHSSSDEAKTVEILGKIIEATRCERPLVVFVEPGSTTNESMFDGAL
jgi:hypothetical protein